MNQNQKNFKDSSFRDKYKIIKPEDSTDHENNFRNVAT